MVMWLTLFDFCVRSTTSSPASPKENFHHRDSSGIGVVKWLGSLIILKRCENMSTRSHNDAFDLYKAVLALMVIMIHTVMMTKIPVVNLILVPLVRLAVPLFFLFSGYFLFGKLQRTPKAQQWGVVKHSFVRYWQLYLFWFILDAPVTFANRHYFAQGIGNGLYAIVTNVVFGSTFVASWYIAALAIDAVLLYVAAKFLSNRWLLGLTFIINIYCVLLTNYGATALGQALWAPMYHLPFWISPYIAFPVGLFWLVLGKVMAENKDRLLSLKKSLWLLPIAFAGLFYEQYWVMMHHTMHVNDSFFMLMPVCFLLFSAMIQTHFSVPHAHYLRAYSTITYCFHASFAIALRFVLAKFGIVLYRFSQSVLLWAVTAIACVIVTVIIVNLEQVRGFGWLKVSH